jgi:hypothetical protein
MEKNPTPTVRDLYPHLSETELAEAEANLERYLELMLRVFEHLELESSPPVAPLSPDPDVIQCLVPGSAASPRRPPSA